MVDRARGLTCRGHTKFIEFYGSTKNLCKSVLLGELTKDFLLSCTSRNIIMTLPCLRFDTELFYCHLPDLRGNAWFFDVGCSIYCPAVFEDNNKLVDVLSNCKKKIVMWMSRSSTFGSLLK